MRSIGKIVSQFAQRVNCDDRKAGF